LQARAPSGSTATDGCTSHGQCSAGKACAKTCNTKDADEGEPATEKPKVRRSARCNKTGASQSHEQAYDKVNLFKNHSKGPKVPSKPHGFYGHKPADDSADDSGDKSADDSSSMTSADNDDGSSAASYSDRDESQAEPAPDAQAWQQRVKEVERVTGVSREP
jgi:hypothetical protein